MSPLLFVAEKRPNLFPLTTFRIQEILLRITIEQTQQTPSSIQRSIQHAGKDAMFAGTGFKQEVEKHLLKIQSVRWILRKLVLRWLFRRLAPCTTEDIVTLEPIKAPIHIVDWATRHIYSFEEKTLHQDITASLQHSDGIFAYPIRPKNPLTNLPLTLGQVVCVWESLARASFPLSSVVSQYRSVQFDHKRFVEEYSTPLSVLSMKRCILNPLDREGADILFDFIENAYDYNNIYLSHASRNKIYTLIYSHKDNDFLRAFRRKCIEYNYSVLVRRYSTVELLQELYRIYRSCMPIMRTHVAK